MTAAGFVYLVGAGPWEPGLLTVRGRELLGRADVVVYDYLANPELLAFAPKAEHVLVGEGAHRITQDEIGRLLVERALAGQTVVRLKGGDPFVFGRGGEEATALVDAGVPFEVVPGVTAAVACAAYAGIPVTHRGFGSTLAFVAGHARIGEAGGVDWDAVARMGTVALYMGARNLPAITQSLMRAGRSPTTPVALIRWATRPDQETHVSTLGDAAADAERLGLAPPLMVLVGEVVSLRDRLTWFEKRPLSRLRIAITRSTAQAGTMAERLRELGADVVHVPTIELVPPADPAPLNAALGQLGAYDWIVFTSANGVDFGLDALYASGRDPRAFGKAQLACIGPATAKRLRERGLVADLVPESFVAEGLLDAFLPNGQTHSDARFLLLRAEVAREVLPDTLRAAGAHVDVVTTYRTQAAAVEPSVRARIAAGDVDVVTFTASSTVRHFCDLLSAPERAHVVGRVKAVCIGPVTRDTALAAGFDVVATAEEYTVPGLIEALARWRARG